MHSSPIDALARAPVPQKAGSTETEPDGGFSDLLRQPNETGSDPVSASADSKPDVTEPSQDQAAPNVEVQGSETSLPGLIAPDAAVVSGTPVQPTADLPEAITRTQAVASEQPAATAVTAITVPKAPDVTPSPATPKQPEPGPLPATPASETTTAAPSANGPIVGNDVTGIRIAVRATTTEPMVAAAPNDAKAPQIAAAASQVSRPIANQPARPQAAVPSAPVAEATAEPKSALTVPTPAKDAPAPVATPPSPPTTAKVPAAGTEAAIVAVTPVPEQTTVTRRPAPAPADPAPLPEVAMASETPKPKSTVMTPQASSGLSATPTPSAGAGTPTTTAQPNAVAATPAASADPAISEIVPATSQSGVAAATGPGPAVPPTAHAVQTMQVATGQTAPPPAEQVVLHLRRAVTEGVERLSVQMKPATLGRVDIQMEVGFDGRVQAVISAERAETLQLLQRDARALTTAFNDAGLQADSGSLSFNLRGQSGDQFGNSGGTQADGATDAPSGDAVDADEALIPITVTLGDGRVDIKV